MSGTRYSVGSRPAGKDKPYSGHLAGEVAFGRSGDRPGPACS